jgi:hypothetical protein
MVMSPAGLGSENECAGEDQQQFYTTDPSPCQRGRPISTNPELTVIEIWYCVPDGCLTARQTLIDVAFPVPNKNFTIMQPFQRDIKIDSDHTK